MASAKSFHTTLDLCAGCLSKHNRNRSSMCECKHCSNPFCFDCMKEHIDELQQDINKLSDFYNQVKALINVKRKWITDETMKSKEQMSEWLEKLIRNLITEKENIDRKIEQSEKEAQNCVREYEAELQDLTPDIDALTKTGTFQSVHMKRLEEKIGNLLQRLSSLDLIRDYDLPSTMPKYTHKFTCPSKPTIDTSQPTFEHCKNQDDEESDTDKQSTAEEQYQSSSNTEGTENEDSDDSLPDENYFCNREKFESTSYVVHCMASDGVNIMYSTIDDPQCARIAYCYLDNDDDNYRKIDPSREWRQSRIVDMVWWASIDTFVCVTEKGIYKVEYFNERFRILSVVNNHWTDPRIAVNTDNIWIHANQRITVYDIGFQLLRNIAPNIARSLTRTSFCLTDNCVAFAFTRRVENDRNVLEIRFYSCEMQRKKTVRLGLCETSPMIRTDGNDRFYVTTEQQLFHIISSNGTKETVKLGKQASCIAVVNSQSIVLTKLRSDLELVRC